MKKILVSIICFAFLIGIIPANIQAAKTYDLGKGWRMVLNSPNTGKRYYHIHIYTTDGKVNRCIRLDTLRECDQKKKKGKIPTKTYDKIMNHSKIKNLLIAYHKTKLVIFKKAVPRWAWYSAAGLVTIVAIATAIFPIDDAAAIVLWRLALSV